MNTRPFILLMLIAVGCNSTESESLTSEKTEKVIQVPEKKQTAQEYVKSLIDGLDGGNIDFDSYKNGEDFTIFVKIFDIYADALENYKNTKDPNLKKLLLTLEAKVRTKQVKQFPRARKAYAAAIGDKLWEENIYVTVGGGQNTTLTFAGVLFADNKNIKDFHTKLTSMFYLLRFKQIRYKWYKEADEFTYFDSSSAADSKIQNSES